jgi:hypothetical protein
MTRNRIVARARVMGHRQIPAIQELPSVTNRGAAAIDTRTHGLDLLELRQGLRNTKRTGGTVTALGLAGDESAGGGA